MLAVARNHLRLPPLCRPVAPAAAVPGTSTTCSTYGSRAVTTSSETNRQEREGKSKSTSTWMKMKWLLPPAIFFCIGTERLYKLLEVSEQAQRCDIGLKLEVVEVNELYPLSRESSKSKEFRKVKCRGVFDESKSMLVLVNTPSRFHPFAYEYDLLTPFIPHPPKSGTSPVLVNRGRVPRDWADDRKIEKLQSYKIVRDFPQKKTLLSASQPQPVESRGVTRNVMLRLLQHLIPSFFQPQPQPRPQPQPIIELVGIIRSGVHTGWGSYRNPRTIVGAMGLDPNATLYVESIRDTSHENAVVSPLHEDRMLPTFAIRIEAHKDMVVFWYFLSGKWLIVRTGVKLFKEIRSI